MFKVQHLKYQKFAQFTEVKNKVFFQNIFKIKLNKSTFEQFWIIFCNLLLFIEHAVVRWVAVLGCPLIQKKLLKNLREFVPF